MKNNKLEILEGLRGFAALYVVAHHLKLYQYNKLGYLTSQGQGAVILFFVLSGFVMYYANYRIKSANSFDFKTYFIKRFRRIYPVFILALLLAYGSACIEAGSWMPVDYSNLMGNLFNLQDHNRIPNNWFASYYKNGPLWSLSYEWWFYMIFFPIFKFVDDNKQKYLALGITLLGYITFQLYFNKVSITLSYFLIWWSGVELCRSWVQYGKIDSGTIKYIFGSHILLMTLWAVPIFIAKSEGEKLGIGVHPILELRHYLYSFLIILTGVMWHRFRFVGLRILLKPFMIFAPISYGIYVFHAPFVFRYDLFGFDNEFLRVVVGMACVCVLSWLAEVKLQKVINKYTKPLLKR